MTDKPCQHKLYAHSNTLLSDGRNYLVVACTSCGRQWDCQPIDFSHLDPIGPKPRWVPPQFTE